MPNNAGVNDDKYSIDHVLQLAQRKLVVSRSDINLDKQAPNEIFILMVEESRGSAGGRAAGSGNRRIDKVYGFRCENGKCAKIFESDDGSKIESFDIPYSAVAMDITLSSGKPLVVQGVVDSELTDAYQSVINNLK